MQRQYHHPLEEGLEERIHTPIGVRSMVEDSHLMKLLRELDKDGFNVDGPVELLRRRVATPVSFPAEDSCLLLAWATQ